MTDGAALAPALDMPVALFLYNRPALTAATFAAIRAARPRRLFLVADGPRDVASDAERCAAARAAVAVIDWPCAVEHLFSDAHLGCGPRIASGLDHVFAAVEAAIIVEDDCWPAPDFFPFCATLLDRYRDEPRVMMVNGTNPLDEWKAGEQSYHFARFGFMWGWATWRRAWRYYDFAMQAWAQPETRARIRAVLDDDEQFAAIATRFQAIADGRVDTWDIQWEFAALAHDGLVVVPARNLVHNRGFDREASHTRKRTMLHAIQRVHPLAAPLTAPPQIAADRAFDRRVHEFYTGRVSAAALADLARTLLARGRRVQALAALKSGAARHPGDATLAALTRTALAALGRDRDQE